LDLIWRKIGFLRCHMITWVVFLRMFWNFISSLAVKRGGSLSFLVQCIFTSKLLIKFQNILTNTTQVIIRHRVKILFSVISSPITLERQRWKSLKMKGILLSFHFCRSRVIGLDMTENRIFTLCRMIIWVVFLRIFLLEIRKRVLWVGTESDKIYNQIIFDREVLGTVKYQTPYWSQSTVLLKIDR
jgi:hypothetical protein